MLKSERHFFSFFYIERIPLLPLGQMVQKCLQTDGLGYQVFNVSNDNHSVGLTSEELINIYYQQVPVKPDEVTKSN